MPDLDTPKELFETNCATNSEPFALQNIGRMMEPEFSANTILIIDPTMALHNRAYAVIRYQGELYFRQYLERGDQKFLVCLNTEFADIELIEEFETIGCVVQQKQRKQKPLHYYHLNKSSQSMDFTISGKIKSKDKARA